MKDYKSIGALLTNYFKAANALKEAGLTRNKKDFTSQTGEWLVSEIYGGTMATSGIQKGWDLMVGDKRIQVKTHSKALTTPARWSVIKHDVNAEIDELIIVVFTEAYTLAEFYVVPWIDALNLIRRQKERDVIHWNHLKSYQLDVCNLPNQPVIELLGMAL